MEKKYTILIVEDEDPIREIMEEFLLEKGYDVFTAQNGKEGFEIAKKILPDIILLDLIMPVEDGMIALKKLKKNRETSQIPIFILTNLSDSQVIVESYDFGLPEELEEENYVLSRQGAQNIKFYLNSRIKNAVEGFFIKSNMELVELEKRISFLLQK